MLQSYCLLPLCQRMCLFKDKALVTKCIAGLKYVFLSLHSYTSHQFMFLFKK